MTSISKNVYTDKLANIVNKYNKTNHSPIKMKPADIKSKSYIDFDRKFKIGDHKRISKYENIFAKIFSAN